MRQPLRSLAIVAGLTIVETPVFAQGGNTNTDDVLRFVKTHVVEDTSQDLFRQFFGRVTARETVDLSFEVGGYLNVLNAPEGVRVAEGTVLAQLDAAPFRRAVERAQLALTQAERDLERARQLAATSAGSQVRVEDAETARDLASVALREAEDALSDSVIDAPFDGLVATRIGVNFSTVEPGQPMVRLHDMSEAQVEFDLPERLLRQIDDPEQVRFVTTLPGMVDPVSLRFVEFHAETDRIGQSYTVTLAFPDIEHPLLVPGVAVSVTAMLSSETESVVLPASAIVSGPDRENSVLVLDPSPDGHAVLRRQPVFVTSATGTRFSVNGLSPGTEIVAVGAHLLREGEAVRRYAGLTVEED